MFRKKLSPAMQRRQRPQPGEGQRSSLVFSYHTARSRRGDNVGRGQEPPKASARGIRGSLTPRRFMRWLVGIAVIGLAAHFALVTPEPNVVAVGEREQQAFLQEDDVYERAAASFIAPSLLNRNKLTFGAKAISRQMREQFPELAEVSIRLPLLSQQPTIHLRAFTPKLILEGQGGTFVLDREGRAFLPGAQVPELEHFNLPVVRDESGLPLETERIALPEREVMFVTEVIHQFNAAGVQVAGMKLPAGNSELEVQIQGEPYVVRFDLYGDAREGAGRYLAARSYLSGRNEKPREYIDVRVNNRVHYQ
jgi:hypothetical protein